MGYIAVDLTTEADRAIEEAAKTRKITKEEAGRRGLWIGTQIYTILKSGGKVQLQSPLGSFAYIRILNKRPPWWRRVWLLRQAPGPVPSALFDLDVDDLTMDALVNSAQTAGDTLLDATNRIIKVGCQVDAKMANAWTAQLYGRHNKFVGPVKLPDLPITCPGPSLVVPGETLLWFGSG